MRFFNTLGDILSLILIVLTIFIFSIVIAAGILPTGYFILFLVGLPVLVGFLLYAMEKQGLVKLRIIGELLTIFLIVVYVISSIYLFKTGSFMKKIRDDHKTYATYYIMSKNDSMYKSFHDILGFDLGVFNEGSKIYNHALETLEHNTVVETVEFISLDALKQAIYNDKVDGILVSSFIKEYLENSDNIFKNDISVIYSYDVDVTDEDATNPIGVDNIFTIYISGVDTYGDISLRSTSDVNMLVTVNGYDREMLFTSIPGDFYVKPNGMVGYKDTLSNVGLYGINNSVATIKELSNIDINYYLKFNFSSMKKIIDTIGGIDVYSDRTFVPYTNQTIKIKEGFNHMNGEMALAFVRERYAFENSNQYIKNGEAVIEAIIKKITSTKFSLKEYGILVDEFSNTIRTNLSKNDIKKVVQKELGKKTMWKTAKYTMTGDKSTGFVLSMGEQKQNITVPNEESVAKANNYIVSMKNGRSLSGLGL